LHLIPVSLKIGTLEINIISGFDVFADFFEVVVIKNSNVNEKLLFVVAWVF